MVALSLLCLACVVTIAPAQLIWHSRKTSKPVHRKLSLRESLFLPAKWLYFWSSRSRSAPHAEQVKVRITVHF
jgi:hypothetical protein